MARNDPSADLEAREQWVDERDEGTAEQDAVSDDRARAIDEALDAGNRLDDEALAGESVYSVRSANRDSAVRQPGEDEDVDEAGLPLDVEDIGARTLHEATEDR